MSEFDTTVTFDPEEGYYRAGFDPLTDLPSIVIVEAFATINGIETTALDPLYFSVDPEALDSLIRTAAESGEEPSQVTFSLSDITVRVRSEGDVLFHPAETKKESER